MYQIALNGKTISKAETEEEAFKYLFHLKTIFESVYDFTILHKKGGDIEIQKENKKFRE